MFDIGYRDVYDRDLRFVGAGEVNIAAAIL